jgi:hypothetical protein
VAPTQRIEKGKKVANVIESIIYTRIERRQIAIMDSPGALIACKAHLMWKSSRVQQSRKFSSFKLKCVCAQ